jgi:hypothetical protein
LPRKKINGLTRQDAAKCGRIRNPGASGCEATLECAGVETRARYSPVSMSQPAIDEPFQDDIGRYKDCDDQRRYCEIVLLLLPLTTKSHIVPFAITGLPKFASYFVCGQAGFRLADGRRKPPAQRARLQAVGW